MSETETANFQQLVRRRLAGGAPCSLNPDEIAATQALFEERDRLQEDRDTWRRVAERLEREKIALAQDVLNGRDRRIAQAEALEHAADNIAPVFRKELKAWAAEKRRQAEGGAAS